MSKDISGPVNKLINVEVDLGPRIIMAGSEVLGTADNISIQVAESTEEELEKLKAAYEIRLVKMLGESATEPEVIHAIEKEGATEEDKAKNLAAMRADLVKAVPSTPL